ncbi:galactose oxidase [Cadophora sp. DSE1049]|nr:galactose oxidase [Cadophora sp. DSE1049]
MMLLSMIVALVPISSVLALPSLVTPAKGVACASRFGRDCWETLAPLGGGLRQEHTAVLLDNKIYVIGGIKPDSSGANQIATINTVEAYDVSSNSWSNVAPLPIAMNHGNAAAVNGKIYVLGGLSGNDAGFEGLPNCYVYDPTTDVWTELPPMPVGTERGSATMGVKGDTIILAGGIRLLVPEEGGIQDTVDIVSSYNTVTGKWTTHPSLPEGREHAGGAVIRDTFYVLGGRFKAQVNVRDTVYALDLKTFQWSERAGHMPTPRGGVSAAAIGNKIYTFGGEGNLAEGAGFIFNETEVYDVKLDCWEKRRGMLTPRHGMVAVAVNDKIYTPGGGTVDFAMLDILQ